MEIFSADSTLMRILSRIADVMLLNICFLATALPVVTIGASLTALNFTAMRIATGRCESVTGDFFRSFRQNLRQATALWVVLLAFGGVLAVWYVLIPQLALGAIGQLVVWGVWFVVAFASAMNALFVFPYLARFEGTVREVLRNARLMSWRHPLASLSVLALLALSAGVTAFVPQATGYGLLWLVIGFAGLAIVAGAIFARVFERYQPAAPAPVAASVSDES